MRGKRKAFAHLSPKAGFGLVPAEAWAARWWMAHYKSPTPQLQAQCQKAFPEMPMSKIRSCGSLAAQRLLRSQSLLAGQRG
mmetsp:Transcript_26169/g.57269  ORF Transcript_26169/g.57269 Transcript_26169/m.57269 type:complete len:81 (-) Transcript_26169:212-454(-)